MARSLTQDEALALKFGQYLQEQILKKELEILKLNLEKEQEISKLTLAKEQEISKLNLEKDQLKLETAREISKLKLEVCELTGKAKVKQWELTDCKTLLMKARGVLNLRVAWETYENERSSKKMRNQNLGRRETWDDLLNSSTKFNHCFAQGTNKLDKVISTYTKLSKITDSRDFDVFTIEKSKFDDVEICVIKTMLEDLSVRYEIWHLGYLVDKYPDFE